MGVEGLDEAGELGPVVLGAEEEAVGVPRQEPHWRLPLLSLLLLVSATAASAGARRSRVCGGERRLLRGPVLRNRLEETLHRCLRSLPA